MPRGRPPKRKDDDEDVDGGDNGGAQERKRVKLSDSSDRVQFWTSPGVFVSSGGLSSGGDGLLLQQLPQDSPLEQTLKVLGTILLGLDPKGELTLPAKGELTPALDLRALAEAVQANSFQSLAEFQFATQIFFRTLFSRVPSPRDPKHQLGKHIYTLMQRLIAREISRFKETSDLEDYVGDGFPFVPDLALSLSGSAHHALKTRTRSRPISDDKMMFGQKFALAQKSVDGTFFFTSPLTRYLDDATLDTAAAKIKIEPTLPLPKQILPKLGAVGLVASSKKVVHGKKLNSRVRTNTVDFPEYGPFHSFAPSFDSEKGTLSRSESIQVKYPGRKVYVEEVPELFEETGPLKVYRGEWNESMDILFVPPSQEEINKWTTFESEKVSKDLDLSQEFVDFLKQKGISPQWIVKQLKEDQEIHDVNLDLETRALLHRNKMLLARLVSYQEQRFSKATSQLGVKKVPHAHLISEKELELASALKRSLAQLLSRTKPSSLSLPKSVLQTCMQTLFLTEKAYKGSLLQTAPFAVPCNVAGTGTLPAMAGTIPVPVMVKLPPIEGDTNASSSAQVHEEVDEDDQDTD